MVIMTMVMATMVIAHQVKRKKGIASNKYLYLLVSNGVADGARTHDNRNHNPGLYQLSYSHR